MRLECCDQPVEVEGVEDLDKDAHFFVSAACESPTQGGASGQDVGTLNRRSAVPHRHQRLALPSKIQVASFGRPSA